MKLILITRLLVLSCLFMAACGGDESGDPLIAGSMTGSYDGDAFEPAFGYATFYQGSGLIGVGDGPLHCGSENSSEPPTGMNAVIAVPALEVGSYSSVFIQLFRNVGSFEGVGSNGGTVELTSVTDESIAGSVEYAYTDDDDRQFSLSGTFEVKNCLQ